MPPLGNKYLFEGICVGRKMLNFVHGFEKVLKKVPGQMILAGGFI